MLLDTCIVSKVYLEAEIDPMYHCVAQNSLLPNIIFDSATPPSPAPTLVPTTIYISKSTSPPSVDAFRYLDCIKSLSGSWDMVKYLSLDEGVFSPVAAVSVLLCCVLKSSILMRCVFLFHTREPQNIGKRIIFWFCAAIWAWPLSHYK